MSRPDNCDGSYGQFCDKSREYSNITAILQEQGRTELLSYMKKYWPNYEGDDEEFWEHEWNKHGKHQLHYRPLSATIRLVDC
ncbi:unnamed protein product [Aspergillus oryzae]|uniref:Unnamed protein product n=2 Tax=Aspergillus oryzae TaxID=5062 RepID=A0AAN5C449_ASPOZ|nr:unnamed protein product [Aspergillus oryzae]GMF92142.1 unnamed protein product [Aspergillus oryzae]GMG00533.1 unnamed protein product [Aspergillus oryzae]GMG37121.1 unnamed protein product [Aspergillus oryzae]GMG49032.1 unnamed protein product [Aspergillus oryzae var. brunneus]